MSTMENILKLVIGDLKKPRPSKKNLKIRVSGSAKLLIMRPLLLK